MKPALLLLHGFTGSPLSFDAVVARLGRDFDILIPALSGHARLPLSVETFEQEVERLSALLGARREVVLCGYSLGARLALGLLVRDPARFARATLIGVHPGLSGEDERTARREADARWARVLREQGIEAFVERWSAQPLFASQGRASSGARAAQEAVRLSHDAQGLARSLEVFSLGAMPCFWPALPTLGLPVTLAAGELDDKFVELARRAEKSLALGRLLIAPGAGHNLVLESPDWVARAIVEGQGT